MDPQLETRYNMQKSIVKEIFSNIGRLGPYKRTRFEEITDVVKNTLAEKMPFLTSKKSVHNESERVLTEAEWMQIGLNKFQRQIFGKRGEAPAKTSLYVDELAQALVYLKGVQSLAEGKKVLPKLDGVSLEYTTRSGYDSIMQIKRASNRISAQGYVIEQWEFGGEL
jgi:hypothetical protein